MRLSTVTVVTADKADGSRVNVRHVAKLGGGPYIALKSNTVAHNTQTMTYNEDDSAWRTL